MNVKAVDKSTQKSNKITISNNKGRLSAEEIEKLVKEAEKNKGEDEKVRLTIDAKNQLESYIYSVRNSIKDEKLKDKFKDDEKKKIEEALNEAQKWYDAHHDGTAEQFKEKVKELEDVFNPIMTRIYQESGGQGMPGAQGFPGG